MAYSQWTKLTSDAGAMPINRSGTSPIVDSFSFVVGGGNPITNVQALAGLTSGADIPDWRVDTLWLATSTFNNTNCPMVWGMMQTDIGLNRNCYYARLNQVNPSGWCICRGSINGSVAETILATINTSGTVGFYSPNTVYAAGLQAQVDADTGDVLLTLFLSSGTSGIASPSTYNHDSNVIPALGTVVDNSASKLTSGKSCGIAARFASGAATSVFRFDQTRILRV
jgi:hypothetical protein